MRGARSLRSGRVVDGAAPELEAAIVLSWMKPEIREPRPRRLSLTASHSISHGGTAAMRTLLRLLALVASVDAHGVLTDPPAREGAGQGFDPADQGVKLQPFGDARRIANEGCGGTPNGGLANTVKQPTAAYTPGGTLLVKWKVTIPHDIDRLDTGVRLALHYSATDSFELNVRRAAGGRRPRFPLPARPRRPHHTTPHPHARAGAQGLRRGRRQLLPG